MTYEILRSGKELKIYVSISENDFASLSYLAFCWVTRADGGWCAFHIKAECESIEAFLAHAKLLQKLRLHEQISPFELVIQLEKAAIKRLGALDALVAS